MKWKTPKKIESNPNDQALLGACREGDARLAQDCIARGAQVDCVDNESGWMPLHSAVAGFHVETVQVLLGSDANPDLIAKANGLTPLGIVVRLERKPPTRLQQRLRKRGSVCEQEQKVLMIAEALLRFGADPSGCVDIQSESTPLHTAASQGRLELVKLLLEYGALMIHCPDGKNHRKLQRQQQKRPSWKAFGDNKSPPVSISTNTQPATPLGIACRTGRVAVMDYLLSALPPQTLESSYVLQQALEEAQRSDQMECLVGLWEYSEEILLLDNVVEGGEVDPARKASLVKSFFDIFTRNASNQHDHAGQGDDDSPKDDTSTNASWFHVLHEACRRRSVNLLEPLLQRLPHQEEFFQKLRKEPSMGDIRANLIQAVDPRDHQTLLHRYCTAPTTASPQGNSSPDEEVDRPSQATALGWISRLLQLSRECDEDEMEEMRVKAAAAANNKNQEQRYANYENDSKFTMETSELDSESDDSNHCSHDRRQQLESGSQEEFSSSQMEKDPDSSEDCSGSEQDESDSEEESETGAGTDEERSVHSVSALVPPVADLQISQQGGTHEDSDLGEDSSEEEDSSEGEDDEEESSYFIESQTCSESEEGIRSESSSDAEAELQSSFAVALPSHSGKDLVNTGDTNLQTALHLACSTGLIPAIEILLQEENILVNAQDCHGNTPLLLAERTEVIRRLLLDHRTEVNLSNKEGTTPLLKATQSGDMTIAQIFLQNGADLEIGDQHGRTPLYLSCARGCTNSCAYLLAYGADPNATTTDGERDTPMHAACRGGHLGVILRLFTADVEAKDANGRTPLHVACCVGHVEIVEYLVTERHANLNVQDKNGLTPFEVACHAGRDSVAYYLVRYHTSHLWDRKTTQRFFRKYAIHSEMISRKNEYETFPHSSHVTGSYREDPFFHSHHWQSASENYITTEPYSPYCHNNSYDDGCVASYSLSSSSNYYDESFVFSSRYGSPKYQADSIYY